MGTIKIEIPQKIDLNYRLISDKSVRELLNKIESLIKNENQLEEEDILGLWTDVSSPKIKSREV